MNSILDNLTPEEKVNFVTSKLRGTQFDGKKVQFFNSEKNGFSSARFSCLVKWSVSYGAKRYDLVLSRMSDYNAAMIEKEWTCDAGAAGFFTVVKVTRTPKEILVAIKLLE